MWGGMLPTLITHHVFSPCSSFVQVNQMTTELSPELRAGDQQVALVYVLKQHRRNFATLQVNQMTTELSPELREQETNKARTAAVDNGKATAETLAKVRGALLALLRCGSAGNCLVSAVWLRLPCGSRCVRKQLPGFFPYRYGRACRLLCAGREVELCSSPNMSTH